MTSIPNTPKMNPLYTSFLILFETSSAKDSNFLPGKTLKFVL